MQVYTWLAEGERDLVDGYLPGLLKGEDDDLAMSVAVTASAGTPTWMKARHGIGEGRAFISSVARAWMDTL